LGSAWEDNDFVFQNETTTRADVPPLRDDGIRWGNR
jgi:hypothetical protein